MFVKDVFFYIISSLSAHNVLLTLTIKYQNPWMAHFVTFLETYRNLPCLL